MVIFDQLLTTFEIRVDQPFLTVDDKQCTPLSMDEGPDFLKMGSGWARGEGPSRRARRPFSTN